jgi:hypothetical protein
MLFERRSLVLKPERNMCYRRAWVPNTIAACCLLVPLLAGCFVAETIHQTSSPDLKILLQDFNAQVVPGHSEALFFYDPPLDDQQFAAAIGHIRAYAPAQLYLDGSKLTDASLPTLMQLDSVRDLSLGRTGLAMDSLTSLATLPNLKSISVDFDTAQEQKEFHDAMEPNISLSSFRFIDYDSTLTDWALTRRVTLLRATKVACADIAHTLSHYIPRYTGPP